jgi:hypothetical protein
MRFSAVLASGLTLRRGICGDMGRKRLNFGPLASVSWTIREAVKWTPVLGPVA